MQPTSYPEHNKLSPDAAGRVLRGVMFRLGGEVKKFNFDDDATYTLVRMGTEDFKAEFYEGGYKSLTSEGVGTGHVFLPSDGEYYAIGRTGEGAHNVYARVNGEYIELAVDAAELTAAEETLRSLTHLVFYFDEGGTGREYLVYPTF